MLFHDTPPHGGGLSSSAAIEVSAAIAMAKLGGATEIDGILGSRMTGAGFGECTVSLVKEDCVDTFTKRVGKEYIESIGYPASFYVSEIGDGGREIVTL